MSGIDGNAAGDIGISIACPRCSRPRGPAHGASLHRSPARGDPSPRPAARASPCGRCALGAIQRVRRSGPVPASSSSYPVARAEHWSEQGKAPKGAKVSRVAANAEPGKARLKAHQGRLERPLPSLAPFQLGVLPRARRCAARPSAGRNTALLIRRGESRPPTCIASARFPGQDGPAASYSPSGVYPTSITRNFVINSPHPRCCVVSSVYRGPKTGVKPV
jgi:hypothetical protein